MHRPILIWPHADLTTASDSVSTQEMATPEFKALVKDMFETMKAANGIGLAAVQVGVHKRVFVMNAGPSVYVFVNPVIKELAGEPRLVEEGCLSLPGIVERVMRYPEVVVQAQANDGSTWTAPFTGLEAQCIQHEMEHLEGKTLADGFGVVRRQIARKTIRKALDARRSR